jgi:hypothetical protein
LAWGFKFSKFSILDRNFINWSWSKKKLICKEGIHADTNEFVIIQIVSVFITPHLVFCFSTPAFCLGRDFVAFKMCHEIMTRPVLLFLQFWPMGQILQTSYCCNVSQENNNFTLHQFFEGQLFGTKKTTSLSAVTTYFC